jgi:fucose permease
MGYEWGWLYYRKKNIKKVSKIFFLLVGWVYICTIINKQTNIMTTQAIKNRFEKKQLQTSY